MDTEIKNKTKHGAGESGRVPEIGISKEEWGCLGNFAGD